MNAVRSAAVGRCYDSLNHKNFLDNSRQLEYRGAGVDVQLEVYSEILRVFDSRAVHAPEADDAVHALADPVPPAAR